MREVDVAAALLGAAIARARVGAGLTQVAAARRLGISQSRLAKLETARRRLTFLEAIGLARAFDVPISELEAAVDPVLKTPGSLRRPEGNKPIPGRAKKKSQAGGPAERAADRVELQLTNDE
jgi:transcriptional regulator with XRE-family HTH domain